MVHFFKIKAIMIAMMFMMIMFIISPVFADSALISQADLHGLFVLNTRH